MNKFVTNHIVGAASGLLCGWGLFTTAVSADLGVEEKIKVIRTRCDGVERSLKRCKQVNLELPGESTEGGELTAYFSGKSLRKLAAHYYGETGQALEEYYFWDGRLFFVVRVVSRYDKPLSGVVKSKTEERFYFDDDRLIRWLDPEKEEVVTSPEVERRGRELIDWARKHSASAKSFSGRS